MSPINCSNEFDVLKTSEIEIKVHNFVDDIKQDIVKKYRFYMTYFAFIFLFFKSFNKAKIDSQYKQKIKIKIITWFSLMPIFVGMYSAILSVFTWNFNWNVFTIAAWVMLGIVFVILVFLLPYLILDSFNKKIKKDHPKSSKIKTSYSNTYDSYYINKKDHYENSRSIFKDFHKLSTFRKNTIFFGYFITSFLSMSLVFAIIVYLVVYFVFVFFKKENNSNVFWALLTFIIAISILVIKTFCSIIYLFLVGKKIKSFPYFYLSTFLAIFFPIFGDILLGYFLYLLQKHLKKYPL